MMMSPRGDVDPGRLRSSKIQSSGYLRRESIKSFKDQNYEVTWLTNITWDDADTWDVFHV
jgi:hypothetical protein